MTSAFPPRVQQLLILFMASEDDDQFLPGLVLHHPHHALQTGAAREAPLLGERLRGGWGGGGLGLGAAHKTQSFQNVLLPGSGVLSHQDLSDI